MSSNFFRKTGMYDNMDSNDRKEYGDFVRMLVFALKIAKRNTTKVIVEFTYGHKNTAKKKKPLVKGQLVVCDFPNIRVRDNEGWTKRYRIDKIDQETFRQKLEDGSDIKEEYWDSLAERVIQEQEAERIGQKEYEKIRKDLDVKAENEPNSELSE